MEKQPTQATEKSVVYWEKQGRDQLCGVHTINSLLQGPFFNEIELASIARELDDQEKNLMALQGEDSKEYLEYLAQDSNNVADDGNYSIQVLQAALQKMGQLSIESVDSQINKGADLSSESGFICNSDHHWFAIRQVEGVWYNLNSTNRVAPEIISEFYLSAFLMSVKEGGYTIFVVRGSFPPSSRNLFDQVREYQKWYSKDQLAELHKKNLKDKNFSLNIGGTDQRDLDRALKESMEMYNQQNKNQGGGDKMEGEENEEEQEEEEKFKPFQGQGISMGGNSASSSSQSNQYQLNEYFSAMSSMEDPELAFVLKLSMQSKFENRPKTGIFLQFRFPDGSKKDWTFEPNTLIRDIYDFVQVSLKEGQSFSFVIGQNFPRVEYTDLDMTIEAAGLVNMTALIITKRQ